MLRPYGRSHWGVSASEFAYALSMTADLTPHVVMAIAAEAEVTGIAYKSLSRFYELPPEVKGLRTLDVCSGMSDFAYGLRQRGAGAYALDLLYADFRLLRARHQESFREVARDVFQTNPDGVKARKIYQGYVQSFQASLKKRPRFYVAGSATHLPFADASFDLVTSFNGVFGTLDFDIRALSQALAEVVRVLRPGGSLQLLPYQKGPILDDHQRQNQIEAVEALGAADASLGFSDTVARESALLGGGVARLTITKAG
ncbi:MAG: methyltransferase domain-containing protein [Dehalococcoidia bacterium]|nr:methyltransferase domain-containing protein [Dehalococcoidia bacterium]